MRGNTIKYKGENYTREVELIGDVERVRWYHEMDFKEVYDQNKMLELEDAYEMICIAEITPQIFYI